MRRLSAATVYVALQSGLALCFGIIFTITAVYRIETIGLSALQLVLVGTVLEGATFVLEVPTGVIADTLSRRLSVILGVLVLGVAAIIEGSMPFAWAALAVQVVWALGYALISGASEAWIADEVGEEQVGALYRRATRLGMLAGLVGSGISVALGSLSLQLPIISGGALIVLLGVGLIFTMTEDGFTPTPRAERSTWRAMGATFTGGIQLVRGSTLLLWLLLISALSGAWSEGFDRLWQAHFLRDIGLPSIGGLQPVVWFAIFNVGATGLGLLALTLLELWLKPRATQAEVKALFGCYIALIVCMAGFALAGAFSLALAMFWGITTFRKLSQPLFTTWLNRHVAAGVRATVFSLTNQVDALGQILGGPVIGALATGVSLPVALLVSALMLTPILLIRRQRAVVLATS